ncbi:MAG: hypothetical protein IKJ19_02955 [Clostridia bacterium]|nr:hypothetical protein [Clostridia bacterium]
MISNEKQYKRTGNTKYAEDFVDYNPEMKASRNAYTEDLQLRERKDVKNTTADFDQMIDSATKTMESNDLDLLPTPTTMQFVGKDRSYIYEDLNEKDTVDEEDDQSVYKINTKGKIMIAVYALVVLTIFALIIMNTRLIKSMNTSISEQEARIEMLQTENQELNSVYNFVSSDEEIARKATEMGMIAG